MKKIILSLWLSLVFLLAYSLANSTYAANVCNQFYVDPQQGAVGAIFTARATGCLSTNVGYQAQILKNGQVVATVDMADLTGDRSQYSGTFLKADTDRLTQGNYAVQLIDKETGSPIQGTTIIVRSETGVADITAQATLNISRDLAMCIGGFASPDDLHAARVKLSCTGATPLVLCPLPVELSYIDVQVDVDNGKFWGCKTLEDINSKITQVTLEFFQGPTLLRTLIVDTSSGRADYICHPTNDQNSSGIKTAIGCVPIDNINVITSFFVRWTMGIIGGVAMLLIIIASYQIITSQGDKYKLQSGKDMLTAALAGLIMAMFAIFIVRVFGQNLLHLF